MSARKAKKPTEDALGGLGHDPLSADGLLERTFYQDERPTMIPVHGPVARVSPAPSPLPGRATVPASAPAPVKPPKPTHYKVVSISLYQEDIEKLEAMVAELKRRGHTKANKSQLIRFALDTVDLSALPKSY